MGTKIRINRQRFVDWYRVYSFVVEINTCWLIGGDFMKIRNAMSQFYLNEKKVFYFVIIYNKINKMYKRIELSKGFLCIIY